MDRFNKLRKLKAKHKSSFIKTSLRIISFAFITSLIYFFISNISYTKYIENENLFLQVLLSTLVNLFTTVNLIIVIAIALIYFYSARSVHKKFRNLVFEITISSIFSIVFTTILILIVASSTVNNHLLQNYKELEEENYSTEISEIKKKIEISQVNTDIEININHYFRKKVSDTLINYNNSPFQNSLYKSLIIRSDFEKEYNIKTLLISDYENRNVLIIDETFTKEMGELFPTLAIKLIEDRYGNFYKDQSLPTYTFIESSSEAKADIKKEIDNSYRQKLNILNTKLNQSIINTDEFTRLQQQKNILEKSMLESKARIQNDINVLGYFIEPNKIKIIAVADQSKSSDLLGVTIHESLHYLSNQEINNIHPYFDEGITQLFTETLIPQYSSRNIYADPVKKTKMLQKIIGEEELALIYFSKDRNKLDLYLNEYMGENYILNNSEKLNNILSNENYSQ